MLKLAWVVMLTLMVGFADTAKAELYYWKDENGVKRFSNEPPPEGVKVILEAEELVQETLYRGAVKVKSLRTGRAVRSWFCRILINRWRDRLRRSHRRDLFFEDLSERAAPPADDPALRAQVSELRERIALAVAHLPPGQRAVLALRLDEDLSVGEIADVLKTTAARVKANLWHARTRLRALLGDLFEETLSHDR